MDTKLCKRCDTEKATAEFYKSKSTIDNRDTECKVCRKARRARWGRANRSKLAEGNAEWSKQNQAKRYAHGLLAYAVKSGTTKAMPCEVCGMEGQAHHPDYTKPLAVTWLCRLHHAKEHLKEVQGRQKQCGDCEHWTKWKRCNYGLCEVEIMRLKVDHICHIER